MRLYYGGHPQAWRYAHNRERHPTYQTNNGNPLEWNSPESRWEVEIEEPPILQENTMPTATQNIVTERREIRVWNESGYWTDGTRRSNFSGSQRLDTNRITNVRTERNERGVTQYVGLYVEMVPVENPTPVQIHAVRQRRAIERDSSGRFIRAYKQPTLKQMWKFAEEFCVGVTEELFSVPRFPISSFDAKNFANTMEGLKKDTILFNALITRSIRNRISYKVANNWLRDHRPDFIINLRSKAASLYTTLNTLRQYAEWPQYRESSNSLNQREVFLDVKALCDNLPVVYEREKKTLRIMTTEPVVLIDPHDKTKKYQFGHFYTYLSKDGSKPNIVACTPRKSLRGGYPHPHVQPSGEICLGNGERAYYEALKSGRIFDAVQIVDSVLHTYGSRPYQDLVEWKGVCDERFDPATGQQVPMDHVFPVGVPTRANTHRCTMCNSDVAELVHDWLNEDSVGCVGCIPLCSYEGCNHHIDDDHSCFCDDCGRMFCDDHMHEEDNSYCINCYGESEPDYSEGEDEEMTEDSNSVIAS